MENLGIGKIITTEQHKDAIHVAIVPVVAGEKLFPGWHVGIKESQGFHAETPCGIVDPFLPSVFVQKGQTFWLFMYPNTVTNLRHDWTHPAFAEHSSSPTEMDASIAWMREAARSLGVSYETLIEEGSPLVEGDYINNGEHIRDIWYDLGEEFWKHRKIITGRDVSMNNRGGFTCSC